jgi:hypothetical protein
MTKTENERYRGILTLTKPSLPPTLATHRQTRRRQAWLPLESVFLMGWGM